MNWARKLDAYSLSLCSSKVSIASCLPAEDLDQRVAGEHLLDVPVELAGGRPLGDELGLRPLADQGGDQDRHRHRDQRDQGQQRRDPEHHAEYADDRQQGGDQLGEGLLQGLRDVVGVVGGPAEHLAARLLVEVGQRQPGQLGLDLVAQLGARRSARPGRSAGPGRRRTARRAGRRPRPRPSRCASRVKSMPCAGGEVDRPTSRSAWVFSPWARSCVDRLRLGDAGRQPVLPITPAKMMSVAWPSSRGPSTDSATLATPNSSTDGRPAPAAA